MFSSTAFEAMYEYLGLTLHQKSVELITSQKIFGGVVLFIFGVLFFVTTMQFFSRYVPGMLVHRKSVPLSKFAKIIGCLFLGIALLEAQSGTSVKRFNGEPWDQNPYIRIQVPGVQPEYRVSLVFDLLSRTAEEFSALLARMVDDLAGQTHSQLEAPNFYFKAIMFGASATLDDPMLKQSIRTYTEDCFDRVLPLVKDTTSLGKLDSFFAEQSPFDQKLSELKLSYPDQPQLTCLDIKRELTMQLRQYAVSKNNEIRLHMDGTVKPGVLNTESLTNLEISKMLADQYLDDHEGMMGVQRGALLPTTGGKVAQYLNRLMSVDGIMSLVGGKSAQGIWVSASRAKEFSENLARAAHVAGFIKMACIAIFPWLIFFVVAGHYRALLAWFAIYFSVLLWAPIWTLMYHIMLGITLSSETMEALSKLGDNISFYGAELVTARMYHFFEVYSWLQIVVGTLFTGTIMYFLVPLLRDGRSDSTPEFISNSANAVTTGSQVAGAVL